ncbi:MAG: type IV pilin biogenesis protein [Acidithiobacillus sp.]
MNFKKSLSILVATSINLLPLQGFIPLAHATGGLNIPSSEQPQVLIILDNSQGMAGVIKGPDGLSGAIMSGSGTVPEDASSSSPIPYTASSGFTPPAQGAPGATVPYSVKCSSIPKYTTPTSSTSSPHRTLGYKACSAFGATASTMSSSAYVDNSESMFNVSENAIRSILNNNQYANNIQFGLETYGLTGGISLSNTWVYYMSGPSGFSFGGPHSITPPGLQAVANPCYGSVNSYGHFTNPSCKTIYKYYTNNNAMKNLHTSDLYEDIFLYIQDTSDNPIINDVLYNDGGPNNSASSQPVAYYNYNSNSYFGTPSNGELPSTFYSYGCYYYGQRYGFCNNTYPAPTLYNYSHKQVGVQFNQYTNSLSAGMTPTSAGYFPLSQQIWESKRGFGFNANTLGNSGTLTVPITTNNSNNQSNIEAAILPEVLSKSITYGSTPITASAGHAPVAGAFQTAINYFSGTSTTNNATNPPPTCGKKYVIYITFGQPTKGTGGHVYPPLGSASASTFGVTALTSSTVSSSTTNNSAVVEAVSNIQSLNTNDGVKTYVIGVGSAVNPNVPNTTTTQQFEAQQGQYVLQAMANAGGTNTVYSATSASALQSALNTIVANILGKSVVSSYAAPPSVTAGSLEFLLKDVNPVSGQGDLYAYPVTGNGSVSSTVKWTANNNAMTNRSSALYTTPTGQTSPSTFTAVASTSTDAGAFAITNTSLTASDIANYTINPSYNNGQYLGGRQLNWFVGLPSSAPAEVLTPPNNANLIGNGGSYLNFAASHANRQNAVLFSDNDGFLYALGYNTTGSSTLPTLLWGWMPGALLPALQNYQTFWQGNNMGDFSTIDAFDTADNKWHTYVVGTANYNGAIGYDLRLTGTGTTGPNLKAVVAQYQLSGYSQPQPSAPVFYQVQNSSASNYGTAWALFAVNSSSGSYLAILNVATGKGELDKLPFSNTATPYIDQYGDLFLGDSSGNVYEMSASTLSSTLTASSSSTLSASNPSSLPSIDFTTIGNNYAPWGSSTLQSNVQFIGGSFYQGANYLRVQGPDGITIFKQTNNSWAPVWTTYSGGAGSWSGGTYTSLGSTSSTIDALPSGSTITDQALINGGNIIVPVTIPAASDTCGYSTAAYYIYNLGSGIFPSGAFVSSSGTVKQGFVIGRGTAFTPSVTMFNGRALLQGAASQNTTGGTSGFASALGAGLPTGGPVAWRLDMTQ